MFLKMLKIRFTDVFNIEFSFQFFLPENFLPSFQLPTRDSVLSHQYIVSINVFLHCDASFVCSLTNKKDEKNQ